LATLASEGFGGATTRAIARRGGFNQALIFYYFGSLEGALVAALERTSAERLARYREGAERDETLPELVGRIAELYEEDRVSGHVAVVAQLLAGSVSRPTLAPEVLARVQPWLDLAEETLARFVPRDAARDLAHGVVALFLGLNLLTHLGPEADRTGPLLARARELAPLLLRG
jgi:AcrR family transcriptional regulator